jgi:hypothetical protein
VALAKTPHQMLLRHRGAGFGAEWQPACRRDDPGPCRPRAAHSEIVLGRALQRLERAPLTFIILYEWLLGQQPSSNEVCVREPTFLSSSVAVRPDR